MNRRACTALLAALLSSCAAEPSDPNPAEVPAVGGAAGNAAASGGMAPVAGSPPGGAGIGGGGGGGVGGIPTGTGGSGGVESGGAPALGGAGGAGNGGVATAGSGGAATEAWVGTWSTAQQLTEDANEPPAPGLTGNTLRQIVQVSIGGARLRLRFSNEYGSSPVTLGEAHVATPTTGSAISDGSSKKLTFSGAASVTIPAKNAVWSDAFDYTLAPLSKLAVSVHFTETSSDITGHPGSRTTSFVQAGNSAAAATLASAVATDHWYILSGIDVTTPSSSSALVVLGDSITDGRGSTTNANDRWPDALAKRLQARESTTKIGVLNQGIGGNAVLSGGLGPTATARFEGDVLKQSGVRFVIVFEGVNDIGAGASASSLISAYQQFVTKARAQSLRVYGATILPFKGNSYYSESHEAERKTVNEWIRKAGNFDATIDLDAAVRDPQKTDTLLGTYDSGDHLHLNPAGYQKLADAVDLALFE